MWRLRLRLRWWCFSLDWDKTRWVEVFMDGVLMGWWLIKHRRCCNWWGWNRQVDWCRGLLRLRVVVIPVTEYVEVDGVTVNRVRLEEF